jgi:hypothetical protein
LTQAWRQVRKLLLAHTSVHSPPQPELLIRNGGGSDKNQKSSQAEHSIRNGGSSDKHQKSSQAEHSIRNGGSSNENQKSSHPEPLNRNGDSSDKNHMSSQVHSLTVEEYRIAGPVCLSIPVRYNGLVGQRYRDAWEDGLKSDVHQILHNRNIRAAVNLDKRRTEHIQVVPRSADYIFIEVTEPSEIAQWLSAANEILTSCRNRGLSGLNVEIADPRGLAPRISATISSTLSIVCD